MMPRTDRTRPGVVPWIGLALAAAVALWFAILWSQARRDAADLRAWQATMLQRIATARGGDTPLMPEEAPDALARIIAARDGAETMVAAAPAAAPPVAPVPPPAPSKGATKEIARLSQTQSTGTAAGDAQIIEQDSRAAWTGWE